MTNSYGPFGEIKYYYLPSGAKIQGCKNDVVNDCRISLIHT